MSDLPKSVNRDRALDPIDLIPEFAFWRDGCRTLAKNVCKVLTLVGEEISDDNILAFIKWLPRNRSELESPAWKASYCCRCLEKMFNNMPEEQRNKGLDNPLMDYFLQYFPARTYVSQLMLIDAFVGIITGWIEAEKELEKGGGSLTTD